MNVLVLDLTHGGDVLALTYRSRGEEVTAVDVYGTAQQYMVDHLRNEGIAVARTTPSKKYDLAVVPIHCPDHYLGRAKYEQKITFHRAVGELAHFSFPTIEVTGTKAKTSACHAISHILQKKGEKVLLLTSRGLFSVGETVQLLENDVMISPATLLRLSFMEGEWTRGVFECNLGGTGLADIGVVTTASGDNYPIAAGTRRAVDGIIQMVKSTKGTLVLRHPEINMWKVFIPKGTQVVEFGEFGDINVSVRQGHEVRQQAQVLAQRQEGRFSIHHASDLPGTFLHDRGVGGGWGGNRGRALPQEDHRDVDRFRGHSRPGRTYQGGRGVADPGPEPVGDPGLHRLEHKDHRGALCQQGPGGGHRTPWTGRRMPLDLETIDKNLSTHSSVKGRYLLETKSSSVEPPASFEMVSDPNTAVRAHKVTYWCSNSNAEIECRPQVSKL